jgi:short-subunit dehydrogenase
MEVATSRRIVIVGATSAIAEHCARIWIGTTTNALFLIGRDLDKLDCIAADLRVRNPLAVVQTKSMDFIDPQAIGETIGAIAATEAIDIALIAHGSLPDQSACETDLAANAEALTINGLSPVLFAEAFAGAMLKTGSGRLVLIGSVAGDRGRKSNYVYGSAKGMVERYAQGMQHRLANTNVTVTLVKPGPTDTPMTAHMKRDGARLASVDEVARSIVDGTERGRAVIYTPGKWALIMLIIKHLPRVVFNRMDI